MISLKKLNRLKDLTRRKVSNVDADYLGITGLREFLSVLMSANAVLTEH